jgi:hypothetical protein
MSALPDPAELAPSRDPAAYGRRRLLTPGFFAWAVLLCLLCLAAGWALGRFGVQLTPATRIEPVARDTASRLPTTIPAAPGQPAATSPTGTAADGSGVDALNARVARLEAASAHGSDAAVMALAAADLSEAAQSSAPFAQDLAAYQRLLPNSAGLAALAPLAATGAPTRAELVAGLPDAASAASAAAHQPAKDAGLFSRLSGWIGRVVIIRRVDPRASGVDGVLAKAEAQAAGGDLDGAVAGLEQLTGPARTSMGMADWLDAAQRRIEIDHRIAAIRAEALASLAPPAAGAPS